MNNSYGLTKDIIRQVVKIIVNRRRPEKIVLFGSRAREDNKYYSDIDIAIVGKDWENKDIAVVKNELEETVATASKFDVLNFYLIEKKSLKTRILKEGRVIYESAKDERNI
jgi:predicted nucleotidyltransferase